MKALGALLVVAVCTLFGACRARALKGRRDCLAETIDALRYISSELSSSAQTLPVIAENAAVSAGSGVRPAFLQMSQELSRLSDESFQEIWKRAFSLREISLSRTQRSEVIRLGAYLGRYPAAEQCAAITGCILHLEPELAASRESYAEGRKLWIGLGASAGVMIAASLI